MEERLSVNFSRKDLRKLLIPLVIEQLLAITVGLADSLMVAQVGEAAVSAVSLVDSVNILLINVFAALGTGGAVVAGQFIGRREMEKANRSAMQLLLFMLEVSVGITILVYLLKGFILNVVFGDIEPDVAAYCNTYFMIVEGSTPFLAIYSAGAALFRVMGNASISMKVSLVMNTVNVVGNGILVFGLHRGVEGVAIPTLVSRGVAAIVILALAMRPGEELRVTWRNLLRLKGAMMGKILRIGVPSAMENSFFQLGRLIVVSMIALFGTVQTSANAVANTLDSVGIIIGQAMGLAMVTVVGQCVGAGDPAQVRHYVKKLLLWSYLSMAVCNALIIVFAENLISLYSSLSPQTVELTKKLVIFHAAFSIILWPAAFVLPNALRAANDVRFTMFVGIGSMIAFRILGSWILCVKMEWGAMGVWIAMIIDWVCRTAFFVTRMISGKWQSKYIPS